MAKPLVVVPLDGSELSEGALPYARAVAEATGARLQLVTVWEGTEPILLTDLPAVAKELTQRAEAYYGEYLVGVAKRFQDSALRVDAEVRIGHPVEEIVRLVEERGATMLALGTHGRSGIGRWVYGSVASRLMREAPVPTLVVGPKVLEAKAGTVALRRLLVPLDGSPLAEAALEPAGELAGKLGAQIVLARVIHLGALVVPFGVPETYSVEIEEELARGAAKYLEQVRDRLGAGRPVEAVVLRGFPADQLLDLVDERRIDLVVMTSHARAGPLRAVLGSVADRMLQGKAPVLLVRPEERS